jgi:(p)ppGpp synthase/HD superfamily hydrolase
VLLIKLIDRLHNIQTIESMKIEKQKDIAEETLRHVAIISTEFDDINLEECIYMGSYKIIANKQDYNFYYKKYHRFLSFNDYNLPSPTFENN